MISLTESPPQGAEEQESSADYYGHGTGELAAGSTGEVVAGIFVERIGLLARPALLALGGELRAAELVTGRTHDGALVQPPIGRNPNG